MEVHEQQVYTNHQCYLYAVQVIQNYWVWSFQMWKQSVETNQGEVEAVMEEGKQEEEKQKVCVSMTQ